MSLMDTIIDAWLQREERARFRRMVAGLVNVTDDWSYSMGLGGGVLRTEYELTSATLSIRITWEERFSIHGPNDVDTFKLHLPDETIEVPPVHDGFMAKTVKRLRDQAKRAKRLLKEQKAQTKLASWIVANERMIQKAELRRDMGLTITPAELTEAFAPGSITPVNRLPHPATLIPPPGALKGSYWEGSKIIRYHPGPHQFELEDGRHVEAERVCETAARSSRFLLAA